MASYKAEIEVVAKGLKGVNGLTNAVNKLDAAVKAANKAGGVAGGGRAGRMAAENINALVNAQNKRFSLMRKINRLEEQGVNVAKLRQKIGSLTEAQQKRRFGTFNQEYQQLNRAVKLEQDKLRTLKEQTKEIDKQARIRGPVSPIGGSANIPGSPAAIARSARMGGPSSPIGGTVAMAGSPAARRARNLRIRDIATGAGFPLLFGGGPLQALAGGVGGAVGGLGGSIAFSAIASQVEAFATAAAQTGVALTSTGGALDFMREKSLFSSDAAREHAAVLEEQGRVQELAAHLGQEMANAIGNNGVKALQDLGETTKETTRLWNLLTTQLFRLVSGPLNAFLKVVNQALGGITSQQQVNARKADLGPERAAALDARIAELTQGDVSRLNPQQIRKGIKGVGAMSLAEARKQALSEQQFQVAATPLPVTKEDERRFALREKTKKERKSRLPELQAEVALTERLNVLSRAIAEARRQEDPVREAALKMEQELEKLATSTQKIRLEDIPVAEQDEKIKQAKLQADQKIFDINDRLKTLRENEAKRNAEILSGLEDKGKLLQARLDGNLEEVQLEQEIQKLLKDNKNLDETSLRATIEKNKALEEQVKIQKKLDQVYASIGQSISTGIVDSLTAAVEGTKSLAEVAANTLRNVANILLQFGVNTALGGIGTAAGAGSFLGKLFAGFRASGGPVSGGRSYVVGERGPELFVPNTSGTVVPNGKFGGATNVVVNVDAKGSSASGDSGQAKQLGGLIGAAVQAELVKQQRPGGLLAR